MLAKLKKWQRFILITALLMCQFFIAVVAFSLFIIISLPQINAIDIHKKANAGDPRYQRLLGYYYLTGNADMRACIPKSNKKALYWSGRAARAGNEEAYCDYAQALENDGQMRQAIPWYIKAARFGNLEAARILKSQRTKNK